MGEQFPTYGSEDRPEDAASAEGLERVDRADLRATDKDRERVRRRLESARRSGELTQAEYEQRSLAVDRARTYGSLGELTHDLADDPGPALERRRRVPPITKPWITVSIITVVVWLLSSVASGGLVFFWPMWPIGVLGAVFVVQLLFGNGWDGSDRDDAA